MLPHTVPHLVVAQHLGILSRREFDTTVLSLRLCQIASSIATYSRGVNLERTSQSNVVIFDVDRCASTNHMPLNLGNTIHKTERTESMDTPWILQYILDRRCTSPVSAGCWQCCPRRVLCLRGPIQPLTNSIFPPAQLRTDVDVDTATSAYRSMRIGLRKLSYIRLR